MGLLNDKAAPRRWSWRGAAGWGVEVSPRRVVIVRVARGRRGWEEQALYDGAGAAQAPGLTEVATRLQAECAGRGAVSAAGMPVQAAFTRWIRTPLTAPAKARKVLPSLLDIQLPFPLESCQYRVLRFRRAADRRLDALMLAARRQDVETRLGVLRDLGLDPQVLDYEGLALWEQGLAERPLERDAWRVIAQVGDDQCTLVIGRQPDFQSAHGIRQGAGQWFAEGADVLKAWEQRIRQLLLARGADQVPGDAQWLWAGPGVADAARRAALEEAVRRVLPAARFAVVHEPALFLARACAYRAAQGVSREANLRFGALAHPAVARRSAARRKTTLRLALAAGLLLGALNAAWLELLAQQVRRTQADITRLASGLAGYAVPRGAEITLVQRARMQQAERLAPFLRAFAPSTGAALAEMLRAAVEQGARIGDLTLQPDRVVLRGVADDWDRCAALEGRVRALGFETQLERQPAEGRAAVRFAIKGDRHGD